MINNWIQSIDMKTVRSVFIRPESIDMIMPMADGCVVNLRDGLVFMLASNCNDIIKVCGFESFVETREVDLDQVIYIRRSSVMIFMPILGYTRIKTRGNFSYTISMNPVEMIIHCKKRIVNTFSIKAAMSCIPYTGTEK